MELREMMNEYAVEIGAELYSKEEALTRLIELQKESGAIRDTRSLRREIDEREQTGNTAVSCRIAIPDVIHRGAERTTITAITVKDGIDYGAPDRRPVNLLFMIAGKTADEAAMVKERLMRLLSDTGFTARLNASKNKKEFLALLAEREKLRFPSALPHHKSRRG